MRFRLIPITLIIAALVGGGVATVAGAPPIAHAIWLVGVVVMGAPIVWRTVRGIFQGHLATDIVASLSIVGAIVLEQPVAGLVIVLMQTGGEALERYAEGRASAAVRALEDAAPRVAHIFRGSLVEDVPVTVVVVDDTLLVRPGDVVPCDGTVLDGESELDTASLTGEAIPVRATAGVHVMSGMINGVGSFRMTVTAPAERSQYARIVDLVRSAQARKAPLQRLADKYAIWFTPITVAICAIAVWITHDWSRALAILVVATPCPLILATPVAIIGGINRAARRFVIVRHGAALEALSRATAAVFDKTGTLTLGKPSLDRVVVAPTIDRATVLRYAAAVEGHSSHLLARVLVDAVNAAGIVVPTSIENVEAPGQGIGGMVEGHEVRVGARSFVVPVCDDGVLMAAELERPGATLRAYVAIDRRLVAVLEYADQVRAEIPSVLRNLRLAGVDRVALLSGDHGPIAREVADRVGITEIHGDLLPADKARFIERLQSEGRVVMMVGDGINDAAGLSTADVGIALAAHGGGITAEAADVIVLVDSLERVHEVKTIADRTMRIARQSIRAGLGLSALAMLVAAFGGLAPIAGAALQEVIDVAVILNALRTSTDPSRRRPRDDRGQPSVRPPISTVAREETRSEDSSQRPAANIAAAATASR